MGFIAAADPASKVTQVFTDQESLAFAVFQQGWVPIRQDGTPYVAQEFEGGLILDGAPLNIYLEGVWYPEQRELLAPHWGKDIPQPPPAIVQAPISTDAKAVQAVSEYHTWKAEQGMLSGVPQWALWAGAAALGYWFFLRK